MANIYGIELNNPTANTVVVELFQLGNVGSSQIVNGVVATSQTIDEGINVPTQGGEMYYFTGSTTNIDTNLNTYFDVDPSEVFLSTATSNPLNPMGVRQVNYSDGTSDNILLAQVTPPVSLSDFTTEMTSLFETKVGETGVIKIIPKSQVKNTGATYQVSNTFEVNYLKSESYILNTPSFVRIQGIEIEQTFTSNVWTVPINGVSALPDNWNPTYTTLSGIVISGSTGTDYGEFSRSQTGEPIAINSLRITPLESATYSESERISQLLQPIKFTRLDSDGKANTYCLNPTVDLYQNMTTLDYINLGTKTDDFPLDGNTNFSYQLLPYAKVNIQLDYVQTSNFVFANKELIKEIVELNRQKNKLAEKKSKIAKEYTLRIK